MEDAGAGAGGGRTGGRRYTITTPPRQGIPNSRWLQYLLLVSDRSVTDGQVLIYRTGVSPGKGDATGKQRRTEIIVDLTSLDVAL